MFSSRLMLIFQRGVVGAYFTKVAVIAGVDAHAIDGKESVSLCFTTAGSTNVPHSKGRDDDGEKT
jgi:hypothetical protein